MYKFLKDKFLRNVHGLLIMLLRLSGMQIGEKTWILVNLLRRSGIDRKKLKIGSRCVICSNAVFLCGDAYKLLLKRNKNRNSENDCSKKHDGIIIKDNSFIGIGAVIMNGVSIGPNAVVGAGAVVFNDVKPDTCVAGNPARYVCSLDDYTRLAGQMAIEGYGRPYLKGKTKRDFLTDYFWK